MDDLVLAAIYSYMNSSDNYGYSRDVPFDYFKQVVKIREIDHDEWLCFYNDYEVVGSQKGVIRTFCVTYLSHMNKDLFTVQEILPSTTYSTAELIEDYTEGRDHGRIDS